MREKVRRSHTTGTLQIREKVGRFHTTGTLQIFVENSGGHHCIIEILLSCIHLFLNKEGYKQEL